MSVNGQILQTPACLVTPNDRVLVRGRPLPMAERTRLWRFHKPRGVLVTTRDPQGRRTLFDLLPPTLPRVLSVGRLDYNSEGLLLLTNDGALARFLELPKTGWIRRYRVRAFGTLSKSALQTLAQGLTLDGITYGPILVEPEDTPGPNTWYTVRLREGKNREIRKVFNHFELEVSRLMRLSFGPFELGHLERGSLDEIRPKTLKEQLGNWNTR